MKSILTIIIIHILIPIIGIYFFIRIKNQISNHKISHPPIVDLFIIFGTYGGLLLVTLTALFWKWSGMASLGAFYLVLGAPILMGIIIYRQNKNKHLSIYHKRIFQLGLLYFVIAPMVFLILYLTDGIK